MELIEAMPCHVFCLDYLSHILCKFQNCHLQIRVVQRTNRNEFLAPRYRVLVLLSRAMKDPVMPANLISR